MAMNMNMKRRMKMRGFMCQTPAATAVCMAGGGGEPRSVIVPRRPDRTLVDRATVINNTAKYSRLVESRRAFGSANKRSAAATTTTTTNTMPLPHIKRHQDHTGRDRKALQKPSSVTSSSDQVFQVVVMRVSLHCQGCAGKVKKHLSKMEGVTSFSIDLENKRVTVMGHVSPVGVLESISKVKRAEFWPC